MVETRIILGSRETPQFVTDEFFNAMKDYVKLYSVPELTSMLPDTVRYYVPEHFVINPRQGFRNFQVDVDDNYQTPACEQSVILSRLRFKHRVPKREFDRMTVVTELRIREYYLLLPNARYHHTTIFKNWERYWLLFNDQYYAFNFRQVYTDPHDLNHNIWYFSKPKYQIEITTNQDFRGKDVELKRALIRMMPRAFRWE